MSSLAQATGSDSLEAQADQVRGYASAHGFDLQAIHDDIGSAFNRPLQQRADACAALEAARSQNGILIVPRVDRLTRRARDVPQICSYGVPIHACDLGRRITRKEFSDLVRLAEAEARTKSLSQKMAHAGRKQRGKSKSPSTLAGRRRGHVAAGLRRDDNVRNVVDLALRDPEFVGLSRKVRAERLNAAGLWYVRTVSNPSGGPWTAERLTRCWKQVLDEIVLQSEDDAGAFLP